MGLSWQQGPLAPGAVGHFLTDQPLPDRLLFAEPARRRIRIRFGDTWIADSETAILVHEPGRYPVAYIPIQHVEQGLLVSTNRITTHITLETGQTVIAHGIDRGLEPDEIAHHDDPKLHDAGHRQ